MHGDGAAVGEGDAEGFGVNNVTYRHSTYASINVCRMNDNAFITPRRIVKNSKKEIIVKDLEHYDIFISYKRKSLPTANNLYYRLTTRGYSTFFDLEEMGRDNFNVQLLNYIENAKDVFVILEDSSEMKKNRQEER